MSTIIMVLSLKMVRITALRGSAARPSRKRSVRRSVNIAKVKYQAPTARHQKGQILANARLLARHSRMLRTHKVYTDFQLDKAAMPAASGEWFVDKLTDFQNWVSVLRQDPVMLEKSHTFILRAQINFRVVLNDANFLGLNVFIVTLRKNAANIDPFTNPPIKPTEWIENSQAQGFNIRLNPSIYDVKMARYISLTNSGMLQPAIPADTAGNPYSTWKKFQVNLPLKMSVTQPALYGSGQGSWKFIGFDNLAHYHKYYIMVYAVYRMSTAAVIPPGASFDMLATCVNTA